MKQNLWIHVSTVENFIPRSNCFMFQELFILLLASQFSADVHTGIAWSSNCWTTDPICASNLGFISCK